MSKEGLYTYPRSTLKSAGATFSLVRLEGRKLLVCRPVSPEGVPEGDCWQYGQVSTLNDHFADSYRKSHGYRYETAHVDVVTLTATPVSGTIQANDGWIKIDQSGKRTSQNNGDW